MTTYRITTPRTARLVEVGDLDANTEVVYLACHGYGMDVERFARGLEGLPPKQAAVCPEGLSRFYWGGFDDPVAASWMTRGERLAEIDDFCGWLDRVYDRTISLAPRARLVALGFSQGAATVMRWLDRRRPPCHAIVLWSGTPPEDIAYAPREYFEARRPRVLWGESDDLVPWERARERFAEVGLPYELTMTPGGHRIDAASWARLTRSFTKATPSP